MRLDLMISKVFSNLLNSVFCILSTFSFSTCRLSQHPFKLICSWWQPPTATGSARCVRATSESLLHKQMLYCQTYPTRDKTRSQDLVVLVVLFCQLVNNYLGIDTHLKWIKIKQNNLLYLKWSTHYQQHLKIQFMAHPTLDLGCVLFHQVYCLSVLVTARLGNVCKTLLFLY